MTMVAYLSFGIFLLVHCAVKTLAYNNLKMATKLSFDRRTFLSTALTMPSLTALPSFAFDNRLDDQYLDRTPQTGRTPDYLGVKTRSSLTYVEYKGLAPCDGRPNCWCSSTPKKDNPARYLEPWEPPSDDSISDLKQVIDSYEVGQQGIDGGGFKVIEYDQKAQYLYVQFQSYKYGYIDDTEFWFNPEKKQFDVRSASRLGQSDLGVNAKRLECIGGRLEKEFGWKLKRRKSGALV